MSWPSRFGTLGEKVFGKDDPFNSIDSGKDRFALDKFTTDEMPPTKHPITGEYLTSKSRFREITRSHGFEEVGTAYDNGYAPEKRFEENSNKLTERMKQQLRDRYYGK